MVRRADVDLPYAASTAVRGRREGRAEDWTGGRSPGAAVADLPYADHGDRLEADRGESDARREAGPKVFA